MEKLTLSKEDLHKRLDGLGAQRQKLIDDLNAVSGAIQFCEQLILESDALSEADTSVKES